MNLAVYRIQEVVVKPWSTVLDFVLAVLLASSIWLFQESLRYRSLREQLKGR